jgi:hypothetical protein
MAALAQISIGSGRSRVGSAVAGERAFDGEGQQVRRTDPGHLKDYFEVRLESLRDIMAVWGSMFPHSPKSSVFGVVWPGFAPIC